MLFVVRPAAAADLDGAFLWYERQRRGLGDEFLAAVRAVFRASVPSHSRILSFIETPDDRLFDGFPMGSTIESMTA